MNYTPKNILVTGGAGFIGSHFVRYCLANDDDIHITNVDKLTYAGSMKNLVDLTDPERHHFIHADICDQKRMSEILNDFSIDTIVHFAAESHVDRSISGPDVFLQTNIIGTYTLLETARQEWLNKKKWDASTCRFHHISTDEVFGSLSAHDSAFTETTPYAPNSPYSASKASSDHWVRAYHHTYGLPITLTNCSNNYGAYQHQEKLIPTIIRACRHHTPIPVYGDGSHIRDWLYVEDHCEAIDRVIRHANVGESYNIGGNGEVSNLALIHKICAVMDTRYPQAAPHDSLIHFVTDRLGHDWRYGINAEKIRCDLDWQPRTSLDKGLEKTIAFYDIRE
ncbi:MAG: dTDP-glucose 4,6-dehydratase [Gammaproteobacteria bacterium]|nr:dTDP-glucose 4,6-dehydratase [Gammaproteobacteria bacterium]MCD8543154.1 dTDP-glucose 4,6-dehydratase [Gammaproteobacteria bacterium]